MDGVIVAGLLLLLAAFVVGLYNRLVTLRNRFKNAFAQIDVQLKRRHDLIPNLVETAKGYLRHERETLDAVISARGAALADLGAAAAAPANADAMRALSGTESALTGALGRLLALAETYPDLKANENMLQLGEELATTENRIAFARQAYNDAVLAYNNARETFPGNLVAGFFTFGAAALFELKPPGEREAPRLSIG